MADVQGVPRGRAEFEGAWSIDRRIDDRFAGQMGHFAGEAVFSPFAGGLEYAEAGWLSLGDGPRMRAERRYFWRFEGARVVVSFADGRPFHDFVLGAGASARHLCGADVYDVVYDFGNWPLWRAVWTVRGPNKDYTMTSVLRRLPSLAARDVLVQKDPSEI